MRRGWVARVATRCRWTMRRKRIDSFGPMIEWTLLGLTCHVIYTRAGGQVPAAFERALFTMSVPSLLLESRFRRTADNIKLTGACKISAELVWYGPEVWFAGLSRSSCIPSGPATALTRKTSSIINNHGCSKMEGALQVCCM